MASNLPSAGELEAFDKGLGTLRNGLLVIGQETHWKNFDGLGISGDGPVSAAMAQLWAGVRDLEAIRSKFKLEMSPKVVRV
jgi:hypothetical protein